MKKKRRKHRRKTKKYWKVLSLVPILILVMYIFMLPDGAVRFAILRSGHPLSAFQTGIVEAPYSQELEDGQIGYVLTQPPYDRDKGVEMRNWVVNRYGMIYVAEYNGID